MPRAWCAPKCASIVSELIKSQAAGLASSVASVLGSKGQVPSLDLEHETRPVVDIIGSTESPYAQIGNGVSGFIVTGSNVGENSYAWVRPGLDHCLELTYALITLTVAGQAVHLVMLNAQDAVDIVASSFRRFFLTRTRQGYGTVAASTPPLAAATLAEGTLAALRGSEAGHIIVPAANTPVRFDFPKGTVVYGSRVFEQGQFIGFRAEGGNTPFELTIVGREWPLPL